MKKIFFILSFLPLFIYGQCGIERINIKTCTDTAVIDSVPTNMSILDLILLDAPVRWSPKLKRQPLERRIATVTCFILMYKSEDDGDYHLVLSDSFGHTIIGEVLDTNCYLAKHSKYTKYYKKTRTDFKKYVTGKNSVYLGQYEITGVLFFDKVHNQIGVAQNGIELHPILKIKKL